MSFWFRYGISGLFGLFSSAILFLIYTIHIWWVIAALLLFWGICLTVAHIVYIRCFTKKYSITKLVAFTMIAFTCLVSLLEQRTTLLFFICVAGAIIFFLFHTLSTSHDSRDHHAYKPIRRAMMTVVVFDVYACLISIFSLPYFFPKVPLWVWGLCAVCLFVFGTYSIWQLYFDFPLSTILLWFVIVAITMLELFWVFQFFPFGYFVSAFLVTWLWYLMQLFLRFHLSPQGILWKKQRLFLLGNAALFAIFLLSIVRWI